MRLIVDANVLVGELLWQRGQALISDPRLEFTVAGHAWSEALYELNKRILRIERAVQLTAEQAEALRASALYTATTHVARSPLSSFAHHEHTARRRIPRDPDDWPPVALALEIGAAIWTRTPIFWAAACRPGPRTP